MTEVFTVADSGTLTKNVVFFTFFFAQVFRSIEYFTIIKKNNQIIYFYNVGLIFIKIIF